MSDNYNILWFRRSAKPSFPGPNPGGTSTIKSLASARLFFCFGTIRNTTAGWRRQSSPKDGAVQLKRYRRARTIGARGSARRRTTPATVSLSISARQSAIISMKRSTI